ncbi:MAG: hypothetical protein EXS30_10430 [Pedosphaera sp.]|nr:hypothetical protein [Pedosphaera sp.]
MEIHSHLNTGRIEGVGSSRPTQQAARVLADKVDLSSAGALDEALRNTPEVRIDSVQRAREMVNDPAYPPRETIRQIARLVASTLPEEY